MKKTHFLVLILGAFLLGVVLSSHNGNARSTLDNRNGMNPSLTVIRLGDPKSETWAALSGRRPIF
ncbi:hypothetical protein KPA97_16920 [Burkholderia cenocepacia]|nr:hypothetical protein [Burkholderia cenocepacia]